MALFTIFTGTYNSEKIISRVFESVEKQTCQNFDWIIIDDCSQDNTVGMIENFITSHPSIKIRLIKHITNKGIAKSRKEALGLTDSKYFVTWDHDDLQSYRQLEIFADLWAKHDNDAIANIFAKTKNQYGKVLGLYYPEDVFISDYINVHNKYLTGNPGAGRVVEHHVCVKTVKYLELLGYYELHEDLLGGELPNGGNVWGMLAHLGYKTIFSNAVVRTYYINEPDRKSLSNSKRKDGAELTFRDKLLWVNFFDPRLPLKEWHWKLRNVFAVMLYSRLAGIPIVKTLKEIKITSKKFIAILFYIPAMLLSIRYEVEK